MNNETELTMIYGIEDIRKSMHTLNENLFMIAWQLYISNNMDADGNQYATIKNFLSDRERLQKGA